MSGYARRREAIEHIVRQAVAAVSPEQAVRRVAARDGRRLHVAGAWYELDDFERVRILGAGKATAPMARAMEEIIGPELTDGLVVVKYGHGLELERTRLLEAGHPVPDEASERGAQALLEMAADSGERDLVFFLLSGGASAVVEAPRSPASLADLQVMTRRLLECGASIDEINALRKHLSRIKGGALAQALAPASAAALIVSDVVGDRLDVIGSGPTAPDAATFQDCQQIVARYGLRNSLPPAVLQILDEGAAGKRPETAKAGDACFSRVRNRIVASNHLALEEAAAEAVRQGYAPLILTSHLQGEAREVARVMAAVCRDVCAGQGPVTPPACLLWGGETTVTIRGSGLGGRNQELALAAALALEEAPECRERVSLVCLGTDGGDGPTDAAGAMALPDTLDHARSAGAEPLAHLADNDAYHFFQAAGTLLKTGPTLTNVMDVAAFLVEG